MLLQRLTLDDRIGFNYDYMGAAEYENGATRVGRTAIAQAFIDKTIEARPIQFIETYGKYRSEPVEVIAMGTAETLDRLGPVAEINAWKEAFHTNDKKIVGWMNVGWDRAEPLILLRTDTADLQSRVNQFFADPISWLQEQAA